MYFFSLELKTLGIYILLSSQLTSCAYYFGNARVRKFNTQDEAPAFVQKEYPRNKIDSSQWSQHPLIADWAKRDFPNWKERGKVSATRILLAKLALGQEVEEVNEYLLNLSPWGVNGTSYFLNPKGDYDFTSIQLAAILHLFKDRPTVLYPQTAAHIANKLIISEKKQGRIKAPGSLGILKETENHIMMTEFSRYLKNQYLFEQTKAPIYNNQANGLEDFIHKQLLEIEETGLFEFNAVPYMGYTAVALLILESFTDSEKLAQQARNILNRAAWEYALGSMGQRRSAPYRRRMNYDKRDFHRDAYSSIMQVWRALDEGRAVSKSVVPHNNHQALMATVLAYKLPKDIGHYLDAKPQSYFAQIGHGWKASPEINYADNTFLLTAGGVNRGKISQIVAKPICLFIAGEEAKSYEDCFYLESKGNMLDWNHTGVFKGFACADQAVNMPSKYSAVDSIGAWKLFDIANRQVLVYNQSDLGLLFVVPAKTKNALQLVQQGNPSAQLLKKQFSFGENYQLEYDLNAPKRLWIMKRFNGKALDRKHDYWPRMRFEVLDD